MLLKFFSQYVKFCKFRFPEKLEGTRQGSSEAIRVDDNDGIVIQTRIICPLEPDRALALERIVPYTIAILYTILYFTEVPDTSVDQTYLLYYTLLYYTLLYYTIIHYAIPYYTLLYYTILYFSILYFRRAPDILVDQTYKLS